VLVRAVAGLLVALCLWPAVTAQSPSWTQWRGPARDGVAPAAGRTTWPERLTLKWKTPVGGGYSTPLVSDGRVFVHARQGENETVTALDAASGKLVWEDRYAAPYRVNPAAAGHGPGPKSTPALADGRLFTLGISGILSCLDTRSGKVIWRKPSAEQPVFGTAMSPLVDGSRLFVHLGGNEKGALTAFESATGAVQWRYEAPPAYASPVMATIGGVRQLVTQSRTHVFAVELATGRLLWQIPFTTAYNQNSITPLVVGDVVVYSGLGNGTSAVRPTKTGANWMPVPLWKNSDASMYMSSPVVVGDTLFGLSHRNKGQFFGVDMQTGRTLWTTKGREAENASLVTAGNNLLVLTTDGELIVAKTDPAAFEVVRRYDVADGATWAHPAVVGNRIVVRDVDSVAVWVVE
jgi:outer membrane protein assembly factor BamB